MLRQLYSVEYVKEILLPDDSVVVDIQHERSYRPVIPCFWSSCRALRGEDEDCYATGLRARLVYETCGAERFDFSCTNPMVMRIGHQAPSQRADSRVEEAYVGGRSRCQKHRKEARLVKVRSSPTRARPSVVLLQ